MPGSQDFAPDSRNADALIYVNGALVPRDNAKVSIFDGGFVVGDGVWEGLRLHNGALLFLEQHLDRLYWGATADSSRHRPRPCSAHARNSSHPRGQ